MNICKQVIEKISLQLMFVTFVLAVLMFAVSPVAAQDQCNASNFCDRDSDGFIRNHKKCTECVGERDCDDSVTDLDNTCEADPIDGGDEFTLTLTDGPFQFAIDVFVNSKGNLKSTEGVFNIARPADSTFSSGNDPLTPQEAWDLVFDTCARLISEPTPSISVNPNDWEVGSNSDTDIHIDLQEIFLTEGTVRKEIQIHLRGDPGGRFLPVGTTSEVFSLDEYTIWGKPWSGSGRAWDTCFSSNDDPPLFPDSTLMISIPTE